MHNYPDQDALASAMGLKALLDAKGKNAKICYRGHVDKYNILQMIQLLEIEIHHIDEFMMRPEDEIIIVDGQKGNINVDNLVGEEIACIDHHVNEERDNYLFSDIRSDVGACSSIIASYFVENNIPMNSKVATALVFGIKTDTSNLTRGVSELDIDMFCYLYKVADIGLLRLFENNSISKKDLDSYLKAISDLRVYDNIGIANIGNNCSEAIIGTVSDFLSTLSEIDFTLVYSYRAGGVKFSVRSTVKQLDASKIIKKAIEGFGDGGGHASMAAGFIPNLESEKEAINIAKIIEQKIINLAKCYKTVI